MPNPFLPQGVAPNSGGVFVKLWMDFFTNLAGQIISLTAIVNAVPGVNNFTVATQPALGPSDAGFLGRVGAPYDHVVLWNGTAWEFWDGDHAGKFSGWAIDPGTGYQLCDGTVTAYLTLGVTITETPFTTPDLVGSPAYLKSIGAYTGTVNAKSGSTGTGVTGTDVTSDESAHTHGAGTFSANAIPFNGGQATAGITAGFTAQFNPESVAVVGTSGAGSAHHHSVPALTIAGLAVGSIEMANLGVLPYFRL